MTSRSLDLAASPELPRAREPGVPRYAFLDGGRALAALYVVAHHAWLEVWPTWSAGPRGVVGALTGWIMYGHFAVSVFIVVSGFSLMLPVVRNDWRLRRGARDFLRRRAWRILPPYYAALAFAMVLIALLVGHKTGTHWDISLPVNRFGLVACLLLVQDLLQISTINHVLWSVALEWHIYFFFPLLVLGWRRLGPLWTMLMTLGAAGVLALLAYRLGMGTVNPQYLALFGFGMCAAAIATAQDPRYARLRNQVPWPIIAAAGFLLFGLACWHWGRPFYWAYLRRVIPLDLTMGLATAAALISMTRARGRNVPRDVLSWRPLAFIGFFSFSIYLLHAPLIQVVWQYAVHPLGYGATATFLLTLVLTVAVVLPVAYLFHRVFERPFMSGRVRRPATRAAPAAAIAPESAL